MFFSTFSFLALCRLLDDEYMSTPMYMLPKRERIKITLTLDVSTLVVVAARTGYQRYMDARNQFLHFYAYAVAVSVFVCYTPFFNYRLVMILNYHLGDPTGGFFTTHQGNTFTTLPLLHLMTPTLLSLPVQVITRRYFKFQMLSTDP